MAMANCGKCGKSDFTWVQSNQAGINGILVYCAACGAVVSWSPRP